MKNILIKISYDGTDFSGWQIQKEGRTVQQTLENALHRISKEEIKTISAGRTDAGVHAIGQYANFLFPIKMTPTQIKLALRSNLPLDISISHVYQVTNDFNARYNALSRTYKYVLTKKITPFNRRYKSFIPKMNLESERMNKCMDYFVGRHNFTSFAKFNPDMNNYFCNVLKFEMNETEKDFRFVIQANRFLHNMVRRIIGTIINVSNTKTDVEIIEKLLSAETPENKLISTAPPNGLYLLDVEYPKNMLIQ